MITVFGCRTGAEELEEVRLVLESQWLGMGPKTREFEVAMTRRLGLRDFVLLDSGSNSLHLALSVLDLKPGSEVILPSLTWVACAHAVVLAGHVPVFCDVDIDTHNITAATIAPHITARTGAIMVVHYAGLPARMGPILDLEIPVVEDAAHAIDSRLGDSYCGTLGLIGVFSFDAVKNVAMGEGGGITSADASLVARVRALRNSGIPESGYEASASRDRWWEHEIAAIMPKFLPNDVVAAIGMAQLRKLHALQRIREEIWAIYQRELAECSWLTLPQDAPAGDQHSYFTYLVRVANERRDALAAYLLEREIYTTLRYHPLHLSPIYGSKSRLPAAECLNAEGLNLPLHPSLTAADVERVVGALKAFGKRLI